MATDWKSPSSPVADLSRTPHRLPPSTQAVAYRSLDDCTRMGRRSRAISVPFNGIATNPPAARTRRSSESNLESRQISTDAVRTDGSGGRELKTTDGVRDGSRLGAKRQRVLSESDGDNESRTNPPPPSRQDVDVALPLKSEENGDDPSGNELMSEARDDDGQAQPPQCHYEGCTKHARVSGGVFCRRHGEGRRCKTLGCNKVDVGGGSCRRHGGGRRCGAEGCLKTDVGGGFCVSHGGGKRCQVEGCTKGAQAGGLFCKSHGGGRRCRIKGCMTSAQSGADVLCIKHGGGKRCLVPGCTKLVRKNNRCTKHASQGACLVPSSTAKVTTAVDDSTDTVGDSIEGLCLPSSPSLPDSKKVIEKPVVPEVQTNRIVSVKPPSERGDVELDRAPPPPLAASITNCPSHFNPPLPSMTSITIAGKRSALHSEAEGRPDLRLPVVKLSGKGDPLSTSPQFALAKSTSSVNDPAVSAGDSTLKATGPVPQEPMRSSTGGMFPIESPQEEGRAFQQPLPRFASMEPSFDLGHVVFSSGRIRNFVGKDLGHTADSTLPPHVATDGPLFPPADNGRGEFSQKMVGSNVDLHRYSGSSRFPDGGIERSQLSTPLLPPPHLHSRHLLPPLSSVDRMAPTVPTFAADFGSGGIGDGWSRYAYNGSLVSYVEARGGRLEVGPLNASMLSNGESSTPADPSAYSAQRPFTSNYSLPAVTAAWQRPSTPPSGSSALDDSSGPEDKALMRVSPNDRSMEPHRSEDSSPLAPPQAHCSGETTPSVDEEGRGDAAQECSGGVSKMSRTRSPQTPSQSQTYISLSVKGMMCMESCGQMVQRALGEVAGVRSVTVHFPTRTASVQVEPDVNVTVTDLTSALEAIGFESSCIATSTSEEPALEEAGVNAVWAIASALGLVDGGCAMAWGDQCNCGEDCRCVNCPVHMKKVSHAVDLVLKAVDLSHSTNPASPAQRDVTSSD